VHSYGESSDNVQREINVLRDLESLVQTLSLDLSRSTVYMHVNRGICDSLAPEARVRHACELLAELRQDLQRRPITEYLHPRSSQHATKTIPLPAEHRYRYMLHQANLSSHYARCAFGRRDQIVSLPEAVLDRP